MPCLHREKKLFSPWELVYLADFEGLCLASVVTADPQRSFSKSQRSWFGWWGDGFISHMFWYIPVLWHSQPWTRKEMRFVMRLHRCCGSSWDWIHPSNALYSSGLLERGARRKHLELLKLCPRLWEDVKCPIAINFSLEYLEHIWGLCSPWTGYTSAQPSLGTNSHKRAVFKQNVRISLIIQHFSIIWEAGEGAENKKNSFVKQAEDSIMQWNRISVS